MQATHYHEICRLLGGENILRNLLTQLSSDQAKANTEVTGVEQSLRSHLASGKPLLAFFENDPDDDPRDPKRDPKRVAYLALRYEDGTLGLTYGICYGGCCGEGMEYEFRRIKGKWQYFHNPEQVSWIH